jgi:hypothetical protein
MGGVEGTGFDYENLDNAQTGIHDYFKYLKYGFGRATDMASTHIREGRMTRDEGIIHVMENDGLYPDTYLGIDLEETLGKIDMTIPEFLDVIQKFANPDLFDVRRFSNDDLAVVPKFNLG